MWCDMAVMFNVRVYYNIPRYNDKKIKIVWVFCGHAFVPTRPKSSVVIHYSWKQTDITRYQCSIINGTSRLSISLNQQIRLAVYNIQSEMVLRAKIGMTYTMAKYDLDNLQWPVNNSNVLVIITQFTHFKIIYIYTYIYIYIYTRAATKIYFPVK